MGIMDMISKNPEKAQVISDFLLGFGHGINQTNRGGVSPLTSISAGFNQGGRAVQQRQIQRNNDAIRQEQENRARESLDMLKMVREQQVLAAQAQAQEAELKREKMASMRAIVADSGLTKDQKAEKLLPFVDTPGGARLYQAFTGSKPALSEFERVAATQPPEIRDALYSARARNLAGLDDGDTSGWPKSLAGNAYQVLLEEARYKREGKKVPPELAANVAVARHVLDQENFLRGPDGQIFATSKFGIPKELQAGPTAVPTQDDAPATTTTQGEPTATITTPGGTTLTTVAEKGEKATLRQKKGIAANMLGEIADLLNTGGSSITGARGALKANFGGIARQVGVDVDDTSRMLQSRIKLVQAVLSEIVMGETRLSNEERNRVAEIVGQLDYKTDESR